MSRIAPSSFLIVCVLGIAGCNNGNQLQEFTSSEGRFKVLMPGKPKEQATSSGTTMKTYYVEEDDGTYVASFSDLSIPANESSSAIEQRLNSTGKGILRNTKSKLTKETQIYLQGRYAGRDIEAELPNGKGLLHARFWIVNKRLYQLMVVGTPSLAGSANATKFLKSLTLTQ